MQILIERNQSEKATWCMTPIGDNLEMGRIMEIVPQVSGYQAIRRRDGRQARPRDFEDSEPETVHVAVWWMYIILQFSILQKVENRVNSNVKWDFG